MSLEQQSLEGLDALLDEALEEFGSSVPVRGAGPGPDHSKASSGREGEPSTVVDGCSTSLGTQESASVSASAQAAHPTAGKGLAFNPLGPHVPKRRGNDTKHSQGSAIANSQAAGAASEDGGSQVNPDAEALRAAAGAAGLGELENIEDLSAGLSKLLAELANVGDSELGQAAADLAAREDQYSQQGQQAQQQGDLASTLRALAEQSPSFEGNEEGGGDPLQQLGAHPEMASLVDSIMQQLLSKDVLYQPMKDIGERYPSWLEEHRESLPAEDLQRYTQQYEYIQMICALYESNPGDYTQLVSLLQQMQQCGQPPQEIVDELAPGMHFDPEGLPRFPGAPGGEGGRPGDLPPELAECSIM